MVNELRVRRVMALMLGSRAIVKRIWMLVLRVVTKVRRGVRLRMLLAQWHRQKAVLSVGQTTGTPRSILRKVALNVRARWSTLRQQRQVTI